MHHHSRPKTAERRPKTGDSRPVTDSRPETSNPDTEPPQFIDEQEIKQELMDKFDRLL